MGINTFTKAAIGAGLAVLSNGAKADAPQEGINQIDIDANNMDNTHQVQNGESREMPSEASFGSFEQGGDIEQVSFDDGDLSGNLQDFRSKLVAEIDVNLEPALDHLSDTTFERINADRGDDYEYPATPEQLQQSEHQVFTTMTLEAVDLATDQELASTGYDSVESLKADIQIKASTSSLKGEVFGASYDNEYDNGQSDGFGSEVFQTARENIESTATSHEVAKQMMDNMVQEAEHAANQINNPEVSLDDKLASSHKLFGGKNPTTGEIELGLMSQSDLLEKHMLTLEQSIDVSVSPEQLTNAYGELLEDANGYGLDNQPLDTSIEYSIDDDGHEL